MQALLEDLRSLVLGGAVRGACPAVWLHLNGAETQHSAAARAQARSPALLGLAAQLTSNLHPDTADVAEVCSCV